ncbi:MAG: DUF4340 domain-containing protein [Flavobacteriales bacterium]|nr:DUF4340 domain-containing protein [Flavobacteriales bacterium]
MKNNKFLLATLLILVAIAVYFFVSKTSGTIKNELKDFAITDTASIDKIFISDYKGDKATLTRGDKYWVVDRAHKARPDGVELLLNTFYRIAVKAPVAKAALNNVITDIATRATKVEIYQGGDKPTKVYYIGGATQDSHGTFMVLENNGEKSSVPFITHVPGFNGYLTTRFYANPLQWRASNIFNYQPDEIASLEVTYSEKPEESFKIERNVNQLTVIDGLTNQPMKNVDTNKVYQYLGMYGNINYEMVVLDELSVEKQDSVRKTLPIFTINLTDIYGKSTKIVALHMPNYKEVLDDNGNPHPYDIDRMYGILNDELLLYIQFYTFDKITLPKQIFLK